MSDNSSSPVKGEKDLFRAYLLSKAPARHSNSNIYTFYLTDFEFDGLDRAMRDMVQGIDSGDLNPSAEIDSMVRELKGAIFNLQQLKEGFEAFKQNAEQ